MRLAGAWLVATALTLGAAADASAATWYANASANGSSCTLFDQCKTIAQAVGKAGDGDTIRIAAGTYTESVKTAKRLVFHGNGLGSGQFLAGATFVRATTTGPAFELTAGGTVRDMFVQGANTSSPAKAENALEFSPQTAGQTSLRYIVTNVVATAGNVPPANISAGAALSVDPAGRAVGVGVTDSLFLGGLGGSSTVYLAEPDTFATFDGVNVNANGQDSGVELGGATFRMDGGTIRKASGSALAMVGGTASVDRAALTGDHFGAKLIHNTSTLTARDSLIAGDNAGGAVGIEVGPADTLSVTGSTVIARGPSPDSAVSIFSAAGNDAVVHAVDTAFRAIPTDLSIAPDVKVDQSGGGSAVFDPSHSYYGAILSSGATVPPPGSGSNVGGDPGFTDAQGGDYTLAPGSALVDRGDPGAVLAGELDLPGALRSLDGDGKCPAAPDIGAYERPAVPCTGTSGGPGGGSDTTRPRISRVRFRPHRLRQHRRGSLRLRLSEKATLTVFVERRTGKRWRRVGGLAKLGGPGGVRVRIGPRLGGKLLKLGRYRLRLRAADAAGNLSRLARASFVVVRRR
jgi:hypothetical protein